MPRKPEGAGRRVRGPYSLGGCLTCRRRHVKCDQVKPTCLKCRACGITCEGFSSDLQWVGALSSRHTESASAPGQGSRRHIYTTATRSSMAAAISSSLSPSSVGNALLDIDTHSKNADTSNPPGITIGPFGLFNANESTPTTTVNSDSSLHVSITPTGDLNEISRSPSSLNEYGKGISLRGDFGTPDLSGDWDNHLAWNDIFALDFEDATEVPSAEDLEFLELTASLQGPFAELEPIRTTSLSQGQSQSSTDTFTHIHLPNNETESIDLYSPDIPLLLRNFETVVMPRMASVPVTGKFAWGPMHLELALQTLAEITILKKSVRNQAKLANLLALLSVSSYHLHLTGTESHHPPEDWLKLSQQAFQNASIHLRRSLQPCIQGYKPAKFKEQLIAVQALMARAWLVCDQAESRRLQVDAEKLVRLRGLAKRDISRRIRLLHHVYAWSRIVIESTYVAHDYSKFQHAMKISLVNASTTFPQPDIGHIQEDTGLDDFLRVHYPHEEEDSSLGGHRDAQPGNPDIHLEDLRYSIEDQFHVIYGIPEQWLSLLSRTTRLANWMDATELPQKLSNDALMERLSRQAQSLEDAVCEFFNSHTTSTNIDTNTPPNVCMSRCLSASLLIFFYRRIRNVNPLVLQPYVDKVIEGLEIFDDSLARYEQPGPGSPWAAFMAGCEAMGETRREKLRSWVDRAFDMSGFETYRRAREYMMRVWERIDQSYRGQREALPRPSWMQVSREDRIWIILN